MSKKSYMSLLKEAIAEFDTSDTVEVKGPMLDPILSWDGDGELPIFKDAASILERYYFNEDKEQTIKTLDEADYENDNGKPDKGPAMKNAKGAGTTQAGTSDSGMDKHEEEIAKEAEEVEEKEFSGKEVPKEKEYTDEGLEMENAIIEKLIAEMEDDEDDDDDDDEDEKEENVDEMEMTYTGDEPKVSMPKEKKAKSPEEDTQGAGTQQAGTGPDEGQIPPRKDKHDSFVKPKKYTDENTQIEEALAALEAEMADDEDEVADDEAEKDLDVDKEMTKEAAGPGAVPPPSKQKGMGGEGDDEEAYEEAFNIFKEAIREEDEDADGDADGSDEDELDESWQAAIDADVAAVVENDAITVEMLSLSEAMTSREKDFVWGKINRMFGDCANKCGRIAVSSQARACKDSCVAKKDQAIKAARAKAKSQKMQQKSNVAKAKGKDVKADRYAQKSAAAGAKAKNIAKY